MRAVSNTFVGVVLAIVLIAGLFAAARFAPTPVTPPQPKPDPASIADRIKDGFVGQQKIGEWLLVCGPGRELPRSPSNNGRLSGNSEGKPPAEMPPPPGWKIPRCRSTVGLRHARNPAEGVRITFRQFGFRRVLALFLRLAPGEVSAGDVVTVGLDRSRWQIPVRACGAQFCLALQSIRSADLPALENSKHFMISFRSVSADKEIAISVPVWGLVDSLNAMRRIDR